ncbi:Clan SB, family S8, subtilisin-like serine peptidase [Histomonas meleagridis]|uniref:Clan SB, family S8, subtilisin-like serine peptidase n=1 Tax=Histomonas meleagridis TaxID=135588 RepID=UPI003559B9D2|nr:Clan SB, family S8, subtilisin-like serine peptidase [Histomonas meleagridis]
MPVLLCFITIAFSTIPDDSEITYLGTYHLLNTGDKNGIDGEDINVKPAWLKGYTGKGTKISIYDMGSLYTHEDLIDNFDFNQTWNIHTQTREPISFDNTHGTCTSALASASNNGKGSVGVAYDSKWSMIVDMENISTGIKNLTAILELYGLTTYDIRSMSLAMLGIKKNGNDYMVPFIDFDEVSTFFDDSTHKRNGLGQLFFHAAGNLGHVGEDANIDFLGGVRQVMHMGASSRRGQPIGYSEIGCIFANTPSSGSEVTMNPFRYDPSIYTASCKDKNSYGDFGGTSAAAPIASGIAALVLEANPNLTWRDVQYILALTATINDPKHPMWLKNAAGYNYHYTQGFGRLDAALATHVASNWTNVAPEVHVTSKSVNNEYNIPKVFDDFAEIELEVPSGVQFTEFISFKFGITRKTLANYHFILTSPQGTKYKLLFPAPVFKAKPDIAFYPSDHMRIGCRAFFGENPTGIWKLKFKTESYYVGDKLLHPRIEVWGNAEKPNLPLIERRKAAEDTFVKYPESSTRAEEAITVENAVCGETMKISLALNESRGEINEKNPIPIVLFDGTKTFNLATLTSNPYSMPAPCVFADNSSYTLIAHIHDADTSIVDYVSTKVTFRNVKEPNVLLKPKPYDVVNVNDGLDLLWTNNYTKLKYGLYNEKVSVDVIDIETNEIISSQNFLVGPDSGGLHVPLEKECLKCVVTITPVYEAEENACASFIAPFSAVNQSKAPGKFPLNLNVNGKCGVPNGIVVDENTSKKWVIPVVVVVVVLVCVVVVVTIVCLCKKKNSNKREILSKEIDLV